MNIIKLTTEGDCEGRTTKTVGYFLGSTEQIIKYCVLNNIHPYYNFEEKVIDVIDCSTIDANDVKVTKDEYGYLKYSVNEDIKKQAKINQAMSKLSEEEKKLLGLV